MAWPISIESSVPMAGRSRSQLVENRQVHHDAFPEPRCRHAGIMTCGFQRKCQIAMPEIQRHEADFASLQLQWSDPLSFQLLRVRMIHFENDRLRKLTHSPGPSIQTGAEYDDLRRVRVAK